MYHKQYCLLQGYKEPADQYLRCEHATEQAFMYQLLLKLGPIFYILIIWTPLKSSSLTANTGLVEKVKRNSTSHTWLPISAPPQIIFS